MFANFLKKYTHRKPQQDARTLIGVLAGKVGLVSNLLLFFIKFFAGWVAGSVSIMTDAMNNLADTASSLLTLFGFHAAAKPPDKEHPYGHERSEYISGLLISVIIIFVGFQFLMSSVDRILNPSELHSSPFIFALLIVSILAKVAQGLFYRAAAKQTNSNTLESASQDSLNDVYVTLVVLGASMVETYTGWKIDGFAGGGLALFIIYSGIQMIRKSIDDLLGVRPGQDNIREMKDLLKQFDSIVGYHDLLVHSYGPNRTFASIHIEIDDSWNLIKTHALIDVIEKEFHDKLSVELVCHVDPIGVRNPMHTKIYIQVKDILKSYQFPLKFHDFHIDESVEGETIYFDLVLPDETTLSNEDLYQAIKKDIHREIGDYLLEIKFDRLDLLKEE